LLRAGFLKGKITNNNGQEKKEGKAGEVMDRPAVGKRARNQGTGIKTGLGIR
jgi:hypothetical protein